MHLLSNLTVLIALKRHIDCMEVEASTESRQCNGFTMRDQYFSTSFDNLFANLTNFILFSFLFRPLATFVMANYEPLH